MAYNKGYNPDALPAHAQPDEAAAALSQAQQQRLSPRPSYSSPRPGADYNKPPPPLPNYAGGGRPPQDPYAQRPPPGAYDDGRQHSPRYGAPPPGPASHHPHGSSVGGYASPPPQNYGSAPPPTNFNHGRPPLNPGSRPPPTPAPPRDANDRDSLWRLFATVDKNRSGQLSEKELGSALVNGDWSSFDSHTVRMMIRMFDTDRSGTINFEEFCGLWAFLAAWRQLFDRFDSDRSGSISYNEFSDALVAFGYRLSPQFVTLLFRTYDRRGAGAIGFDLFVQACISLKRMTDVFKKYDEDRDGYITLSFEEFLSGAQSLFLFNSISSKTDTGLY
ncbi:putative peflin protein [Neofusicoccum parvum]|uniref:Peflin protein n=2 Tax=Neofusicoccum parvum TaxID=310453 RepID=A0ACB5RXY1_9PEZI|nr:putative peflin protein [Neofusicoccum parvum UCRNP2]GME25402.1 putative peflin protein [Neofusicoccum parvum]GME31008.1 putative peflin protein [Neofusicoccum parvum]